MRRSMQALRALRYFFGALIVTVTVLVLLFAGLAILRGKTGRRYYSSVSRFWGRVLVRLAGGEIRIVNPEYLLSREPYVVMATHASSLDIPFLYSFLPGNIRFVMKKVLRYIPLLGWYLWASGHFFLDRKNPRQAVRLFIKVAQALRDEKAVPIIFPEGTRSPNGKLQALHPGTFELPIRAGAHVLPVVLLGCSDIIPKGRSLPVARGVVMAVVGRPIPTAGKDRKDLCAEVREAFIAMGAAT